MSNTKRFKLFNSIIVVGNLRECELLLVNIHGVDEEFWLFHTFFFHFILNLNGGIEVLSDASTILIFDAYASGLVLEVDWCAIDAVGEGGAAEVRCWCRSWWGG